MTTESHSKELHIYHADAGTGKTHTLLDIVQKHVQNGVPLSRIAFVTYTKAAAEDAKRKVCERFGINISEAPHFRTIHSMCYHACGMSKDYVMDYPKYKKFGSLTGRSFTPYIKDSLDGIDWAHLKDDQLLSLEQLYRNNRPMAQQLLADKLDSLGFTTFCTEYCKFKNAFGYRDFTDMLQQYIDDDKWEDVDVACIDEAQDSTLLQWQVLTKAFRNAHYIYIAGDIKQSLYTYNGGASYVLLNLKGEQHTLDKSWRVPSNINDFVREHIYKYMKNVHPTQLLSAHQGGTVKHIVYLDALDTLDMNKSYMMLARNRSMLAEYVDWCEEHCIPYTLLGKQLFTAQDKINYKNGLTETWDKVKLEKANRYMEAGTFFNNTVVNISTIHGVKGLEADIVIVKSDISRLTWRDYDKDPENEHYVFYVACTRAREELIIIEPTSKYNYAYLW